MSGYGKIFGGMFTGSMMGAGPVVFAVMSYAIANAGRDHRLEINPALVAAMLGCDTEDVEAALVYLTSPDPRSRSEAEEGRRLLHEGAFTYFVVNHEYYRDQISKAENAARQKKYRESQKVKKPAKGAKPKKSTEKPEYTEMFEAFWGTSWKRGNKRAAFESFFALSGEDQQDCYMAVPSWTKAFEQRDAQKRPHVVTWLNGRGWEDDVDAEYGTGKGAIDKAIESKYAKFD